LAVVNGEPGIPAALLAGTDGGGIWLTNSTIDVPGSSSVEFANSPVWQPVGDNLITNPNLGPSTSIPASQAPLGINNCSATITLPL